MDYIIKAQFTASRAYCALMMILMIGDRSVYRAGAMSKPKRTPSNCLLRSPTVCNVLFPLMAATAWSTLSRFLLSNVNASPWAVRVTYILALKSIV